MRIGLGSRAARFVQLASLAGSYLNIPVARLPEYSDRIGAGSSVLRNALCDPRCDRMARYGDRRECRRRGNSRIALVYLLVKNRLWVRGLLATAGVVAVCHLLARPIPGLGIALPVFVSVC